MDSAKYQDYVIQKIFNTGLIDGKTWAFADADGIRYCRVTLTNGMVFMCSLPIIESLQDRLDFMLMDMVVQHVEQTGQYVDMWADSPAIQDMTTTTRESVQIH